MSCDDIAPLSKEEWDGGYCRLHSASCELYLSIFAADHNQPDAPDSTRGRLMDDHCIS